MGYMEIDIFISYGCSNLPPFGADMLADLDLPGTVEVPYAV